MNFVHSRAIGGCTLFLLSNYIHPVLVLGHIIYNFLDHCCEYWTYQLLQGITCIYLSINHLI